MSGDWFNLNKDGAVFYRNGKFLKAARRFQAALDQLPENAAKQHRACILYNLAQAERARGNPDKAKGLLSDAEALGLVVGESDAADGPKKAVAVPYGSSLADDRPVELVTPAPDPDQALSLDGASGKSSAFWRKMRRHFGRLPMARDFVAAWFCLKDSRTSLFPRFVLICVLLYFVWPVDLVLDALGAMGFVDDVGVLWLGLRIVDEYVTEAHRSAADKWIDGHSGEGDAHGGTDLPPDEGAPTRK